MESKQRTALVVEQDDAVRNEIGGWLEDEGFDVLECPGPSAPDYTCPGGRGESCPLAVAADLVVLDLRLKSDVMMEGTPGFELLFYYGARDKPIVLLADESDPVRPLAEPGLKVLRRPPERRELVGAVQKVLAEGHVALGG